MEIYIQVFDASPTPAPFVPAPETDAPVFLWTPHDGDYDYLTDDTPSLMRDEARDSIAKTPSAMADEARDGIADAGSPVGGGAGDSIF